MTRSASRLAPSFRATLLITTLLAAQAARADAGEDTDFLFRLGMMEGHLIIGHELLAAGRTEMAVPHFGHPVRELYDDLSPYVAAKHLVPFDTQLLRLEAAVAGSPRALETEALYAETIRILHQARLATPESVRASVPQMIRICADTIDAAAGEYGESVNDGKIDALVEYHDSRGYLTETARQVETLAAAHPDPASQSTIARFKTVLAKAQWIVEPLVPAAEPRASVADYRAVATEAGAVAAGAK